MRNKMLFVSSWIHSGDSLMLPLSCYYFVLYRSESDVLCMCVQVTQTYKKRLNKQSNWKNKFFVSKTSTKRYLAFYSVRCFPLTYVGRFVIHSTISVWKPIRVLSRQSSTTEQKCYRLKHLWSRRILDQIHVLAYREHKFLFGMLTSFSPN